jgi:hypothetical protein
MQSHQQRQHDSLRRVLDFLDVNAATVGAVADPVARKELDASVAALTGLGTDQGAADQRMAGQLNRERAIAAELKTQHLAPIAAFARAHLRGSPDYAALTRAWSKLNRATLVRAARSMASAAAPYAAQLALGGFPADTITQLTAAADALEAVLLERANTNRARHSGVRH